MSDEKKRIKSILAIEVLNYTLNQRPTPKDKAAKIDFNISVEATNKVNIPKNLLFVTNKVTITEKETDVELGTISVSLAFEVENLSEVAIERKDKLFEIEPSFSKMIAILSIDTTRGVLFAYFRGSYLQNIILPMIYDDSLAEQHL